MARDERREKMSNKGIGGLVGGAITGLAGWLGSNFYMNAKLLPYDTKVASLTRDDVMRRASAGLASGLGDAGGAIAGAGHNAIREAHALKLIESGEYPLARRIYKLGGRSSIAIAAAIGVGAIGYAIGRAVTKDDPLAVESERQRHERDYSSERAPNADIDRSRDHWQDKVSKADRGELRRD